VLKQIFSVTSMSLSSLPQRIGSSLATVIGIGAVVAVMISLLAVSAGLDETANKGSQPDRAIVLSAGATAAYMGSISREEAAIIADAPGVKKGPDGKPLVDPEATIVVEITKKFDNATANTGIQGVSADWLRKDPHFSLVKGRMFRPGLRELIVGKQARTQFKNMDVGDHVSLRGSDWLVVGAFDAHGGLGDNGIVGDTDTVISAFERNAYQSVAVRLTSPEAFQKFKDWVTSNPQLKVDVKRQDQYAKDQLAQLTVIMNFVGYFVGTVMAVGAVFGALNTMYSAVDSRRREIATLRAIGFAGLPVLISVVVEALVLAFLGACLGALVAWLLFNGNATHIASLTFPLAVTSGLVVQGIIWSLVIGLIGGFAPSIRAARLPVVAALRAT
jgi:putative ABC transport system permease protein